MIETPYTKQEEFDIANELQKFLGPEWISHRNGPSGRLTYIEGKNAITLANEIFGFNGWSSEIKETTVDFVEVTENNRVNIGISVTMRITLKDGSYHEDIGYGSSENARSKATAFEKAKKQAVTDATKRTLRNFGNAVGNCIYDKVYLNNVTQMANPQVKFSCGNLYRHEQFDAAKKNKKELWQKHIDQEAKHKQQLESQRQRQIPKIKVESAPPLPMSVAAPTTEINNVETKTASTSTTPPTSAPNFLQPLVPEDSFSYEGDDEFFVQMLANDEFEEVLGLKVDEDEPLQTPSQFSTGSHHVAPESSGVTRTPPPLSDLDQSRKRSRLTQ